MAKTNLKVVPETEQPSSEHIVVYGDHAISIQFTDDPQSVGDMRKQGFVYSVLAAARDTMRLVNQQDNAEQPTTANVLVGVELMLNLAIGLDSWLQEHGQ